MKPSRAVLAVVAIALLSPAGAPAQTRAGAPPQRDPRLQAALESTLGEAERAIERFGVSDSAMVRIQAALARLALEPALKDGVTLQQIHGSPRSNSSVLATRGDHGLSLFLSRFESGHATPVHDHQTWGVLHVLEGRDHYVQWSASAHADDSTHAEIRRALGVILVPGASVYWFPPPHDLHSQEALDGVVWELVLAGKNFLSPRVLEHRHYFDPGTGGVRHMSDR